MQRSALCRSRRELSNCRAVDSCAILNWSSLSMYFSYVPSIIFSFFNRPLFLNLLFKTDPNSILIQNYSILFNIIQTDPNSILFNIIQYYSILFIRVLRHGICCGIFLLSCPRVLALREWYPKVFSWSRDLRPCWAGSQEQS